MRINNQDRGMEYGIEKMCHANNGKQKSTNNATKRNTESRKNQRKGNIQVLGNIESEQHQTSRDERKNLKRVSRENEKTTRNQTIQ